MFIYIMKYIWDSEEWPRMDEGNSTKTREIKNIIDWTGVPKSTEWRLIMLWKHGIVADLSSRLLKKFHLTVLVQIM